MPSGTKYESSYRASPAQTPTVNKQQPPGRHNRQQTVAPRPPCAPLPPHGSPQLFGHVCIHPMHPTHRLLRKQRATHPNRTRSPTRRHEARTREKKRHDQFPRSLIQPHQPAIPAPRGRQTPPLLRLYDRTAGTIPLTLPLTPSKDGWVDGWESRRSPEQVFHSLFRTRSRLFASDRRLPGGAYKPLPFLVSFE